MKLPRVRFTVRRMMVAVAFVALVLATPLTTHRRAERFRALAEYHALWAIRPGEWAMARIVRFGAVSLRTDEGRAAWHAEMWAKYGRAARFPFLPVAPDPPEPMP